MNKFFFNPLTFVAVLLVAWLVGVSLLQTANRASISTTQLKHLEGKVQALKTEIDQKTLAASKAAEPFVKEKIARDQLLWQKPGEIVIELPATTPTPAVVTAQPTESPAQAWIQLFSPPRK